MALAAPYCSTREPREVLGRGGSGSWVKSREPLILELLWLTGNTGGGVGWR